MSKANLLRIKFSNTYSFKDEQEIFFTSTSKYTNKNNSYICNSDIIGDNAILPVTIFYGANASGKSNALKAIANIKNFLGRTASKEKSREYFHPFGIVVSEVSPESTLEIDYISNNKRFILSIVYTSEQILSENLKYFEVDKLVELYSRKNNKISAGKHSNLSDYDIDFVNDFISKRKDILILDVLDNKKHLLFESAYKGLMDISDLQCFEKLDNFQSQQKIAKVLFEDKSLKSKVVELVKYADLGIVNLDAIEIKSPQPPEDKLYFLLFMHEGEGALPLGYMQQSDGTIQFLFHLLKFIPTLINGGVFLIDELDCKLHPLLLAKFIEMFNNPQINIGGAQLIFTTHSTSVLRPGILGREEIWFSRKNKKGISEVYPLTDFNDVRETTNIEKWYYEGRLGAIPYFDEIENIVKLFSQENNENGKSK